MVMDVDFAGEPDRALVRHKPLQRVSLNMDRNLRAVVSAEAKKQGKPEAAVMVDLMVQGLNARGHEIETRQSGRVQKLVVPRAIPAAGRS